jgi:transposase
MPRYVTSLDANAKVAHIGHPVTACGRAFIGPHRTSENMPTDRRICRECVGKATGYGWITADEADRLLDREPAQRPVIVQIVFLFMDGASDREAAHRLGVSERTISRHIAAAMHAAGVRTRFQWGYRIGLATGRS